MARAFARVMKAKNLDDVLVYRKALVAAVEVSAILERPVFRKDPNLKDQLSRSSGRVAPMIAEGFGQTPTGRWPITSAEHVAPRSSRADTWRLATVDYRRPSNS